eukprot:6183091-Pleurochrysis_carterae.AAC.2
MVRRQFPRETRPLSSLGLLLPLGAWLARHVGMAQLRLAVGARLVPLLLQLSDEARAPGQR